MKRKITYSVILFLNSNIILFLKTEFLCRSFDLTSVDSKTGFQKNLDYSSPCLKKFLHCVATFDSSSYWSSSTSDKAALSGGVTLFKPRQTTLRLHASLDFYTGQMGLLKVNESYQSVLDSPVDGSTHGWEPGSLDCCNTVTGALP